MVTTPRTVGTRERGAEGISFGELGLPLTATYDDIVALNLAVPGTDPMLFACWNGHEFELVPGRLTDISDGWLSIAWLYPFQAAFEYYYNCLLYTSPSPRDS